MGNNKLVRIIVPIIAVVVSLVAIGIAAYFVVTQISDSSKNLEEEKKLFAELSSK